MSNTIQISAVENANAPAIAARGTGTVIKITITESAIADVVDAGFDRLTLERSTDSGLSYEEITQPSERPVLDASKTVYSISDRAGSENYLYRTRYLATQGSIQGERSDPSEAIVGEGLAIRTILTVPELKVRYLFGVDFRDDAGNFLPDETYTHYILAAIRWMEHQLDIPILPTTFVELHDYDRSAYQNSYNLIRLDNYPVISVEEFAVRYPSGQTVIVWPNEWLRLNKPEGHIQIVPTAGTLSTVLIGQGGNFLPALYNGLPYLPQLFEVSYTAGFEEGKVPRDIVELIGMMASLGPFNIFGDLIAGAGIATLSLSLDGLSQSIGTTSSATNAGYGARVIQYLKQIKDQMPNLKRYYKGIRIAIA